jgi:hypothetical protein
MKRAPAADVRSAREWFLSANGASRPRIRTETNEARTTMSLQLNFDPHAQLRALYQALLANQERFDEFKRLLQLYDFDPRVTEEEPMDAAAVRQRLNDRISIWIGGSFSGLSAMQTFQWRAIIVEERFNVSLSPWKESNGY